MKLNKDLYKIKNMIKVNDLDQVKLSFRTCYFKFDTIFFIFDGDTIMNLEVYLDNNDLIYEDKMELNDRSIDGFNKMIKNFEKNESVIITASGRGEIVYNISKYFYGVKNENR